MYSQRASWSTEGAPKPFDNRALTHAVHLVSNSLVKRAGINSGNPAYAILLRQIWGQSQYATIEVLAAKRKQAHAKRSRPVHDPKSPSQPDASDSKSAVPDVHAPPQKRRSSRGERLRIRRDADRDKLVRILRRVKQDELAASERRLTLKLVTENASLDTDGLRRLWGLPKVIFEATQFDRFLADNGHTPLIIAFYDQNIHRQTRDARIFNMLYWYETAFEHCTTHHSAKNAALTPMTIPARTTPVPHCQRSISRRIIGRVIELLLTKRRSPFFEKNMFAVIEIVLYAINPDAFVDCYRESSLRDAAFAQAIIAYEYSRSFTTSLENLQLAKLNRLLKDLRAVRELASDYTATTATTTTATTATINTTTTATSTATGANKLPFLPLNAIKRYCADRETLTDRALRGVHERHARPRHLHSVSRTAQAEGMSEADFVRMYLALVGSGTDPALKYWFSILDQDGDGWVGVGDVSHFYSERKLESEKRNGIMLADVQCLWVRLCAMSGVSPNGRGINLNSLKELGREDREFVMCSLLIRRADDGNLINVAATVTADGDHVSHL